MRAASAAAALAVLLSGGVAASAQPLRLESGAGLSIPATTPRPVRVSFRLAAGEFALVVVEHRTAATEDAFVLHESPSGTRRIQSVQELRSLFRWIAAQDEEHALLITRPGALAVRFAERHSAAAADAERLAGEVALTQSKQPEPATTAEDARRQRQLAEQALGHFETAREPLGISQALGQLGNLVYRSEGSRAAQPLLERALAVARASQDDRLAASHLINLGTVYQRLGDLAAAVDALHEASEIRRRHLDHDDPLADHQLSAAYRALGDFEEALRLGRRALQSWEHVPEARGYAASNIGLIQYLLGDYERASEMQRQALASWRKSGSESSQCVALSRLGLALTAQGAHADALQHHREALAIAERLGFSQGRIRTLVAYGYSLLEAGEPGLARDRFAAAIELVRTSGDLEDAGEAHLGHAEALRRLGRSEDAERWYQEAVASYESLRYVPGRAAARAGLARIRAAADRLTEASRLAEQALLDVEDTRSRMLSPDRRANFLAARRPLYDLALELRMRLDEREPGRGHAEAAFRIAERARARGLLEALGDGRSLLPDELRARERRVAGRVSGLAGRLARSTAAARPGLQAELDAALGEYRELRAEWRASAPRAAALLEPDPVGLQDLQRDLLDEGTLLLEYAFGEEHAYVFAATRDSLVSARLGSRAEIESEARALHQALSDGGTGSRTRAATLLRRLGERLLPSRAVSPRPKRLVVVPDGVLHFVPFAALVPPGQAEPLIASTEVVHLPSASVLAALRKTASRHRFADGGVAVFADPVFEKDDLRLGRSQAPLVGRATTVDSADLLRSAAAQSGVERLQRLAFSREEATAVARTAGPSTLLALDFQASREAVLSEATAKRRVLHFASHALLNNRHPELSGIVLSLFDAKGDPRDGFVRLADIYGLDLRADLVVLSACRTALGREVPGEGLVGLTRGFMHAGAPSVLASLWDVRDLATAELMRRFYRGLLSEGRSASDALRRAQLSLRHEARFASPHLWAGFVLQGDWQAPALASPLSPAGR